MKWALLLWLAATSAHAAEMSWLENGTIRLGVDLQLGGAITWLSKAEPDAPNVINSFDWGRQVQMSFYSGPIPFISGEKHPRPAWAGLGWNPIQAGDDFGHGSGILEHKNDGRQLYVKCRPMQWPLDNVPADCTFESWLELRGATVLVRGGLNNARADRTLYPARAQELPAVYTNGPWHRLFTYQGSRPFEYEPATEMVGKPPPTWNTWLATERWSALIDKSGWGLGVWNPGTVQFGGGFNATPGAGGAKDTPCGYLAPNAIEVLDHDIQYDFHYALILGTIAEIRAEVYRQPRPETLPHWEFRQGRAAWHFAHAEDAGWRAPGPWRVLWSGVDPSLISPLFYCAKPVRAVVITASVAAEWPAAELFWSTLAEPGFSPKHAARFEMRSDGVSREYRVPLPDVEGLVQLRLDPAEGGTGEITIASIRLE